LDDFEASAAGYQGVEIILGHWTGNGSAQSLDEAKHETLATQDDKFLGGLHRIV